MKSTLEWLSKYSRIISRIIVQGKSGTDVDTMHTSMQDQDYPVPRGRHASRSASPWILAHLRKWHAHSPYRCSSITRSNRLEVHCRSCHRPRRKGHAMTYPCRMSTL
jgi:hypothetical protein